MTYYLNKAKDFSSKSMLFMIEYSMRLIFGLIIFSLIKGII